MSLRQVMIQSRREAEEQALRQKENDSNNNLNMNGTIASSSRPLSSTNATKIGSSTKQIGTGKSEEEELPSPMQLPSVRVIALRGKITYDDGKTVLSGKWALEGREFTKERPYTESFSYVNEQSSANDYSGDYTGGFMYGGEPVVDNDLTLFFVPNNGGSHNVTGSGVNAFGCFSIEGIQQGGNVDMCRYYSHAAHNTLSVSRSDNEDSDSESEVDSVSDYLPDKEQASAGDDGGDVDMSLILKKSTKRSESKKPLSKKKARKEKLRLSLEDLPPKPSLEQLELFLQSRPYYHNNTPTWDGTTLVEAGGRKDVISHILKRIKRVDLKKLTCVAVKIGKCPVDELFNIEAGFFVADGLSMEDCPSVRSYHVLVSFLPDGTLVLFIQARNTCQRTTCGDHCVGFQALEVDQNVEIVEAVLAFFNGKGIPTFVANIGGSGVEPFFTALDIRKATAVSYKGNLHMSRFNSWFPMYETVDNAIARTTLDAKSFCWSIDEFHSIVETSCGLRDIPYNRPTQPTLQRMKNDKELVFVGDHENEVHRQLAGTRMSQQCRNGILAAASNKTGRKINCTSEAGSVLGTHHARHNTKEHINIRTHILTQFKDGSVNILEAPIDQILAHLRPVSDAMLTAENGIRPTSIDFIHRLKYYNKTIPSDLAILTFCKDITNEPRIDITLELKPPEAEELVKAILGGIFDLLHESEQIRKRFNHDYITTTNSKDERATRVPLAFVIMERVLVGNLLKPFPPMLKWWQCPNPNCGKYVIKDLGMDGQITCVSPLKGGCGEGSQKVSKRESTRSWSKSDYKEI